MSTTDPRIEILRSLFSASLDHPIEEVSLFVRFSGDWQPSATRHIPSGIVPNPGTVTAGSPVELTVSLRACDMGDPPTEPTPIKITFFDSSMNEVSSTTHTIPTGEMEGAFNVNSPSTPGTYSARAEPDGAAMCMGMASCTVVTQ